MPCDECEMRLNCKILKMFNHREKMIKNGKKDELYDFYNSLELQEAYISEMRKKILKELNHMNKNIRKESLNSTLNVNNEENPLTKIEN